MIGFRMKVGGNIAKDFLNFGRKQERANKRGVDRAGKGLKNELRAQMNGSGLGNRLGNTWRQVTYPENRDSINASSVVFSKAPHIVHAFDNGGIITARNGKYLAIPTDFAPKYAGGGKNRKQMTPQNFEQITGMELFFVERKGKYPILVARGVRVRKSGAIVRQRTLKATKKMGERTNLNGVVQVPMFTLVPVVRLRKRIDVERAFRHWGQQVPQFIEQEMKQ